MILPSKQLSATRSLISIGADILYLLNEPKTVSRLWTELQRANTIKYGNVIITYDWFILALDFLYLIAAIELIEGRIHKKQ